MITLSNLSTLELRKICQGLIWKAQGMVQDAGKFSNIMLVSLILNSGTPNYMAPECIHNKASDKVCDVYSLAGLFYFLKSGNPPFTGGSEYLIFKKSLENLVYLPYEIFNKVEQDLLLKMMDKDWASRIDMDGVVSHEYFKGVDFENLPTY